MAVLCELQLQMEFRGKICFLKLYKKVGPLLTENKGFVWSTWILVSMGH